jgi:chaperonin GroES
MSTNIKPLGSRVLVEVMETEEVTSSGIIIPDSAKEKQQKGTVLATGPGTESEKMEVKAGDVVLYGKFAGTEIEEEGNKYLILNQNEILAIV